MKPEEGADHDQEPRVLGASRGVSMLDLFLRILAIVGTLGSAVAMGTTDETLPFSTQAFIFQAQYDDIPAFRSVMKLSHEMIHFLFIFLVSLFVVLHVSPKVLCDRECNGMWISCSVSTNVHLPCYQERSS